MMVVKSNAVQSMTSPEGDPPLLADLSEYGRNREVVSYSLF
jgi:hypothetical protein